MRNMFDFISKSVHVTRRLYSETSQHLLCKLEQTQLFIYHYLITLYVNAYIRLNRMWGNVSQSIIRPCVAYSLVLLICCVCELVGGFKQLKWKIHAAFMYILNGLLSLETTYMHPYHHRKKKV